MIIEEDAVLGAGAIILPNVTIGRGAIVTAGSVVTKSVPPKTMVQGNPARPIATVEVPLGLDVSVKEFAKGLRLGCAGISRASAKGERHVVFAWKARCFQKPLIRPRSKRPIYKFTCVESVLLLLFTQHIL